MNPLQQQLNVIPQQQLHGIPPQQQAVYFIPLQHHAFVSNNFNEEFNFDEEEA